MSKTYDIKDNTIFSVNDDGSITTIATIDGQGEIIPINGRPYSHLEIDLHHAEREVCSLRKKLSESKAELDKLQQEPRKVTRDRKALADELKRVTPTADELTWRKGINDKLSRIISSLDYTRTTASRISSDVDDSSMWMKGLVGGTILLCFIIIAVLFFYTGSVNKLTDSSIPGGDLKDINGVDTTLTTFPTTVEKKEIDLTKLPLIINDVMIANVEYDGTVISDFGKVIDSQKTKYLQPQIKYFGIKNGPTTLYIKWINPDGSVRQGSSSIGDYSQVCGYNLSVGKNDKHTLRGWGSSNQGYWGKGDYVIEIWYEDIMLIRKPFTIH